LWFFGTTSELLQNCADSQGVSSKLSLIFELKQRIEALTGYFFLRQLHAPVQHADFQGNMLCPHPGWAALSGKMGFQT
jgi:hypothetical protein